MTTSNQAASRWDRANISYENYLDDIPRGRDPYRLTLIDLLHVRNFKGLNSLAHEPAAALEPKSRGQGAADFEGGDGDVKTCCKCGTLIPDPQLDPGEDERCDGCADGGCNRCGAGPEVDCKPGCPNEYVEAPGEPQSAG